MKNKRLLIAGGVLIVLCMVVIKTGVMQVAYSKMQDVISDTQTINYSKAPNYHARASVSPDARQFAYCTTELKEFYVRDLKTQEITTYQTRDKTYQVKYSPNGTYIATGRDVLNLKTGQMMLLDTDAVIIPVASADYIAFSPDSETLAIVNEIDGPPGVVRRPTVIEIWDLKMEKLIQKLPIEEVVHKLNKWGTIISEMVFSPDGRYLAVAGTTITLWEVKEGKFIKSLATESTADDPAITYKTSYESVAYSPDGKYLAAAFIGSYIRRLSIDPGYQQQAIEIWDPDMGKVAKTLDASVSKWDPQKLESVKIPSNVCGNYMKVKYSPDGRYIAAGTGLSRARLKIGDAVWIWDVASEQLCTKFEGYPDYSTYSLDYSTDGKYLSASGHHHLKIWKIK